MESLGSLAFILREKRRQFRDQVSRLIERRHPNMRLIRAEFIADGSQVPFVDRRMLGVAHATLARGASVSMVHIRVTNHPCISRLSFALRSPLALARPCRSYSYAPRRISLRHRCHRTPSPDCQGRDLIACRLLKLLGCYTNILILYKTSNIPHRSVTVVEILESILQLQSQQIAR